MVSIIEIKRIYDIMYAVAMSSAIKQDVKRLHAGVFSRLFYDRAKPASEEEGSKTEAGLWERGTELAGEIKENVRRLGNRELFIRIWVADKLRHGGKHEKNQYHDSVL